MRVSARQRRVVAADLGARPLRMGQEIQIVNRHDLRRRRATAAAADARSAPRRTGPARQHLGGRPAEPMPGEIEQAHRHAAIDDPAPGELVVQRRRSFHELENSVRSSVRAGAGRREPAEQRPDQLVRVFADAAALAQRRTGSRSGRALV